MRPRRLVSSQHQKDQKDPQSPHLQIKYRTLKTQQLHRRSPPNHRPIQQPHQAEPVAHATATKALLSFSSSPAEDQYTCRMSSLTLKKNGQCRPPPAKNQPAAASLSRNAETNHCARPKTVANANPATTAFNQKPSLFRDAENMARPKTKSIARAGSARS